jgi:hypothetical protein
VYEQLEQRSFVQQQRHNSPIGKRRIDHNMPQKVQWLLDNTPTCLKAYKLLTIRKIFVKSHTRHDGQPPPTKTTDFDGWVFTLMMVWLGAFITGGVWWWWWPLSKGKYDCWACWPLMLRKPGGADTQKISNEECYLGCQYSSEKYIPEGFWVSIAMLSQCRLDCLAFFNSSKLPAKTGKNFYGD